MQFTGEAAQQVVATCIDVVLVAGTCNASCSPIATEDALVITARACTAAQLKWGQELSSGEVLAKELPNTRVYKAFNIVGDTRNTH